MEIINIILYGITVLFILLFASTFIVKYKFSKKKSEYEKFLKETSVVGEEFKEKLLDIILHLKWKKEITLVNIFAEYLIKMMQKISAKIHVNDNFVRLKVFLYESGYTAQMYNKLQNKMKKGTDDALLEQIWLAPVLIFEQALLPWVRMHSKRLQQAMGNMLPWDLGGTLEEIIALSEIRKSISLLVLEEEQRALSTAFLQQIEHVLTDPIRSSYISGEKLSNIRQMLYKAEKHFTSKPSKEAKRLLSKLETKN